MNGKFPAVDCEYRRTGLGVWWALLLGFVVALVLLITIPASGANSDDNHSEIVSAVRAPLIAVAERRAKELCADFTRRVAARLTAGLHPGDTCVRAASVAFSEVPRPRVQLDYAQLKVLDVSWRGDAGVATLVLGRGHEMVRLQRVGVRWLISSSARLFVLPGCKGQAFASGCPAGTKVLGFEMGMNVESVTLRVATPAVVKRAGGRELEEFDAGRKVALTAGCAACHRIGQSGNQGPGPALTHIGSELSEREIQHIILHPSAPMPSFRGLSSHKLHVLLRFLALLR